MSGAEEDRCGEGVSSNAATLQKERVVCTVAPMETVENLCPLKTKDYLASPATMDQFSESDWLEPTATTILVYSFLQSSSKHAFFPELDALGQQLWAPTVHFQSGDWDDGELQTDGNRCGRLQNREPVANEELLRMIGTQLAELGDQLAAEIEPSVVSRLVRQFVADNLSREEITRHLSQTVQELVRRMPLGMEKEKAMLVIAMVLARNIANTVPSLLHQVFSTTVNYINHNLQDYVNNLARES